jgi:hypothetical protein
MIIDWPRFAFALLLLLLPIGLFHGKKVRFRPIARDWEGQWSSIFTLGQHWIDLGRAALGGWLLIEALELSAGQTGFMRYSVLGAEGAIMIAAVGLQTFVCREPDSANAPFAFVTGLLLGVYPPIVAGFPILLAATAATGSRVPAAYFPFLAILLPGIAFLFEGRKSLIMTAFGFCAVILPWLLSIMFHRDLVITYRARRRNPDTQSGLPPHR